MRLTSLGAKGARQGSQIAIQDNVEKLGAVDDAALVDRENVPSDIFSPIRLGVDLKEIASSIENVVHQQEFFGGENPVPGHYPGHQH